MDESYTDPNEGWNEREFIISYRNQLAGNILNKEGLQEADFEAIKDKLILIIEDLAELLGSMEGVDTENTAAHYVKTYFPVVDEMRKATDFESLNTAFSKITTEDLTRRFFTTYKKWGMVNKVGKGNFPNNAGEFVNFMKAQLDLKLICATERDLNNLN